jgi:hypothetical protein
MAWNGSYKRNFLYSRDPAALSDSPLPFVADLEWRECIPIAIQFL